MSISKRNGNLVLQSGIPIALYETMNLLLKYHVYTYVSGFY